MFLLFALMVSLLDVMGFRFSSGNLSKAGRGLGHIPFHLTDRLMSLDNVRCVLSRRWSCSFSIHSGGSLSKAGSGLVHRYMSFDNVRGKLLSGGDLNKAGMGRTRDSLVQPCGISCFFGVLGAYMPNRIERLEEKKSMES